MIRLPSRVRFVAWLIRRHPSLFLRWKGLPTHRLGELPEFLDLHARLLADGPLLTLRERYNVWSLVRRSAPLPGACAEVGVYRGGSAELIAAAKGDAALHLFDTFAGMPEVEAAHDGRFRAGMLGETTLDHVRQRLARWPNVHLHPGFFPATAEALGPEVRFKFVHLDVDIRRSTQEALEYFLPRLVPGGVVLVHDYNDRFVPGTRTGVDEVLRGRPDAWLFELWDSQALIVKR